MSRREEWFPPAGSRPRLSSAVAANGIAQRTYPIAGMADIRAFSNLLGYYSSIYGISGLEAQWNGMKTLRAGFTTVRNLGDEGATLAFGGELLKRDNPGFYLAPALFTDVDSRMRIAREEIFGPVATVTRVRDYDEALHVDNDTEFGLSAGICTSSLKYAGNFKRNAEAGMVMVKLPTAGVDFHVPFGGSKGSSFGSREQGRYAAEFYTTVKTAYTAAG